MNACSVGKSMVFFFVILLSVGNGFAQACGYIHAKFYVVDRDEKFVSTARLELISAETGRSILHERDKVIAIEDGALKLTHGLCGSHNNVRLVVTDQAHHPFESTVDLPLNSAQAEHVFSIMLGRKGTNETASIETWGRVLGEAKDTDGNPLAGVQVLLIDSRTGRGYRSITSEYGIFHLSAKAGKYSLEALSPNGDKVTRESVVLPPGPDVQELTFTFNTKPKHHN